MSGDAAVPDRVSVARKNPAPSAPALPLSGVLERGWTRAMVDHLLGDPDEMRRNPHAAASGPKMRMYRLDRVTIAEQSEEFAAAKIRALLRSERGTQIAAQRRAALLRAVGAIEITVPFIQRSQLIREACEHYNRLWAYRSEFKYASEADSPEFLDRICVNFLRHVCSCYEAEFERVHGAVGAGEARQEIRARVYEAISERYPNLAVECSSQRARRGNQR